MAELVHIIPITVITGNMLYLLQGVPWSGLDEGGQDGEDSLHHENKSALQ